MIDYVELTAALENLRPGQKLYKLLKTALTKQGRWKDKPRGNTFSSGYDARRRKLH